MATIKEKYLQASMLLKIVYINIAVFVIIRLSYIGLALFNADTEILERVIALPSSFSTFGHKFWTLFTYMFAHYDLVHIIFNMLWLYWFGKIFIMTSTPKRLFALYIYGGIIGGLLYILAFSLLPYFSGKDTLLIGASASIMAIVVATSIENSDYSFNLLFLGRIKLLWIALVTIFIDLISVTDINSGGHIAHLGGTLIGTIYALGRRKGVDITRPFNAAIDFIVNLFNGKVFRIQRRPKVNRDHKFHKSEQRETSNTSQENYSKKTNETKTSQKDSNQSLEDILAKIKKSGYAGLTAEEKKRIFDISRDNK